MNELQTIKEAATALSAINKEKIPSLIGGYVGGVSSPSIHISRTAFEEVFDSYETEIHQIEEYAELFVMIHDVRVFCVAELEPASDRIVAPL